MEPKSYVVSGRDIKQAVKKKYTVNPEDKKDWVDFTKKMGKINAKEIDLIAKSEKINKVPVLDLHGFSLDEANKEVKKFIIKYSNNGFKKILVITGKGLRSKSHKNPYLSEKLSVLKYSIPEYINSDENLTNKIKTISFSEIKDGGEGAIYIYLKNLKNEF